MLRWWGAWVSVCIAVAASAHDVDSPMVPTRAMPIITADPQWLKLPSDMVIGEVSAVAVDRHDHVWILHRPATVPTVDSRHAARPIVEFDQDGRFVRSLGGPEKGYDWPTTEHSLAIDGRGHMWVTGSYRAEQARADDVLLELAPDGRIVKQIGRRGASAGDGDTGNVHAAADISVDDRANEVYVADGYGNRRVIVFDRRSGAFKRMWSGFGAPPPLDPAPAPRAIGTPFTPEAGDGPPGFNGVHGVELSRDGLVYVSDRNNQRIQVFTRQGRYVRQVFVDRNMASAQTASGIAFSADRAQRYMYVADWGNGRLLVYDRATLSLLGSVGHAGSGPGEFRGPHLIATDSHNALYVAEVQGRRLQKLSVAVPSSRK